MTGSLPPRSISAIWRAIAGATKAGALPRTGVVERARHDDLEAVVVHGTESRAVPARACSSAYGLAGRQRRLLIQRRGGRGIDRGGAGNEDAAFGADTAERIEQVVRGEHVARERLRRVLPGVRDVRGAGTVVHGRRPQLANGLPNLLPVEQIDAPPGGEGRELGGGSDRAQATRFVRSRQLLDQVAAGEPCSAGDQDWTGHVISGDCRTAPGSTSRNAGSPSLMGRHHHSLLRYQSTVCAEPVLERHLRRPAETAQLRRVEAVAAVVARPVGDRLDERCRLAERAQGSGASGRRS